MQDFISLLDGGLKEADAQLAMEQAASAPPLMSEPLGVPKWVTPGVTNFCGKVRTTSDQCVAPVQLGDAPGVVVKAITDMGGAKMLVDLESARAMGLPVQMAKGIEFGTFYGPGLVEQAYAGIVAVPVPICFSVQVVLYIYVSSR